MEVIVIDIFDLGLRIRNVRKAHNLTQEQLAEKIKVSPHYVMCMSWNMDTKV